ncbi:MAG: hypothetical protein JW837_14415 [Sedimentisphaerales bacterium]|nr:hypothetical protein [Sedimentisphaerales bacterium]
MMEVFPHVTLWYMTPDPAQYFIVVGSEHWQYFSPTHMDKELMKYGVNNSLSEININDSKDVMSCYIGDENDLRRFIKSFSVNSDFRPFIEFTTANRPAGCFMFSRFVSCVRGDSVYQHIDWSGFNEEEKKSWLSDYERIHKASGYLLKSNGTRNFLDKLKCCMEGLTVLPENPALLDLRKRTEKEIYYFCSKLLLSGRTETALQYALDVLRIHPGSVVPWMIKSRCMQTMGSIHEELDAAEMAVRLAPENTDTHFLLGSVMFSAGCIEDAITEYRQALRVSEKGRKHAIYNRAGMLDALSQAEAVLGEQFELMPSDQLKEAAENISRGKSLSETTGSLIERNPE